MSRASETALRNAMELQKSGDLEGAFDHYQNALHLLFEDHKSETDPAKKEIIQSIILVYMESAEDLKSKIALRKQSALRQPSPTPLPQPPPSPSPKLSSTATVLPPATSSAVSSVNSLPSGAPVRPDFYDYSGLAAPAQAPNTKGGGNVTPKATAASTAKTPAHRVPAAAARAIHGAKGTSNKATGGSHLA